MVVTIHQNNRNHLGTTITNKQYWYQWIQWKFSIVVHASHCYWENSQMETNAQLNDFNLVSVLQRLKKGAKLERTRWNQARLRRLSSLDAGRMDHDEVHEDLVNSTVLGVAQHHTIIKSKRPLRLADCCGSNVLKEAWTYENDCKNSYYWQ